MLPAPLQPFPDDPRASSGGAVTRHGGVRAAEERLRAAGVQPMAWSNGPGDRYAQHSHPYTKLLICAEGSIRFLIGPEEAAVELAPGDGFLLPPKTRHAAVVGPDGCTCVEGHRR